MNYAWHNFTTEFALLTIKSILEVNVLFWVHLIFYKLFAKNPFTTWFVKIVAFVILSSVLLPLNITSWICMFNVCFIGLIGEWIQIELYFKQKVADLVNVYEMFTGFNNSFAAQMPSLFGAQVGLNSNNNMIGLNGNARSINSSTPMSPTVMPNSMSFLDQNFNNSFLSGSSGSSSGNIDLFNNTVIMRQQMGELEEVVVAEQEEEEEIDADLDEAANLVHSHKALVVVQCANCNAEHMRRNAKRELIKLKKCATCKQVHYCSKSCQVADWEHHRDYCVPSTSK